MQFDILIESTYNTILEQPVVPEAMPPPAPAGDAGASALPGMGADGIMPPTDGNGTQGAGAPDMDNKSKKEADSVAYVDNMLAMLVDPEEGISPEEFNDYLNTFDIAAAKITDKAGFSKFYRNFYEKLKNVIETKQQLNQMFKTFHSTAKDLISNRTQEPDEAGGGTGKSGPSGPGVK